MFSIILTSVLIIVAAISNAVMDTLQFHYGGSIFKKKCWGDPRKDTWKNKWKLDEEGNAIVGKERFLFSSTILVFLTDAWHLFQFTMLVALITAISFYESQSGLLYIKGIEILAMYVLFGLTFELFFSKIFKSNESS